jgi:hypothetical protein
MNPLFFVLFFFRLPREMLALLNVKLIQQGR